jgi:hypothetical protein
MSDFVLTAENYYSREANQHYASYSQYTEMMGAIGKPGCEAMGLAKLEGRYYEEPSTAMLVGSYVDAYFEGTLPKFKAETPEIFNKNGTLKAKYKDAENMIMRAERDDLFMKYMSGQKQVILTFELFGLNWKCKIDSLVPNTAIVDLKTTRDLHSALYVEGWGKIDFVRYWGYDIQGALYQKGVEITSGKKLPYYIAGIEKPTYSKETDLEIIGFNQKDLDDALSLLEANVPRFKQIREREVVADRCGLCNYCRDTKKLTKPIHFTELI